MPYSAKIKGSVVPGFVGLPGIQQDPLGLGGSIQLAGENKLLQVDHAAQALNRFYMQLKPEWNVLKGSVDTLLKVNFLLPRYFEEINQREKTSSIPSAEDVIKSFQRLRTSDRVGHQPLHQFVSLLKSLKNVLPFVKQIKDVVSYFKFQKSLVDSLKKIEDIAMEKRANDTVHPEVLNITKDLKLVKTDIYLPLISTVPSLLDNINTVKETLKNELSSMGTENVIG